MKTIYNDSFLNRFSKYIDFIAAENLPVAKKLKAQILQKTKTIQENPYLHRQSIYFNDPKIRDCVFKHCTIVFRIEESEIIIFGFIKHQNSWMDK